MKWLAEYGVSQSMFANLYMERSQGTMSVYLKNPPWELSIGFGQAPWVMIDRFLNSDRARADFLETVRAGF